MCLSQKLMSGFVGAVIVAGLFGPYMISIALAVTAAIVWGARRASRNEQRRTLN